MHLTAVNAMHPDKHDSRAGLYIHVPFCVAKCGYCAFTSYPCGNAPPGDYLDALRVQAEQMACHPLVSELRFATFYIGGGTPTVYGGGELGRLVKHCLGLFNFDPDPEITVEANPNSIDDEKLATLRGAGVNRLSIGIQAFSDDLLGGIGRSHSRSDALQAVAAARKAGFDNLNLDLIYGLPGQTLDHWQESIDTVISLRPEHLALYGLSVEEGTPFARRQEQGDLHLPDEEIVLEMEKYAYEQLASEGFMRYEISNFAQPGRCSQHNENYWRNGNYLGLGAAAVSCIDHMRFRYVQEPGQFVKLIKEGRSPLLEIECLPAHAAFRETVIMSLRMLDGADIVDLQKRFGTTPQEYYGQLLDRLQRQDLLAIADGRMRLTAKALPVANQVLAELV